MTHEESSFKTKQLLASALHRSMKTKPLDRITVSEIIEECGVNRKTFYYHFQDIFDLFRWMLEQETIDVFKKIDLPYNYEDAIKFVMDYIEQNDKMLKSAIDSSGRDDVHRFFFSHFLGIADDIVRNIEKLTGKRFDDTYREYLCEFYCNAVAGMMIYWIRNHETKDREFAEKTIGDIIKKSLIAIISEYELPGDSLSEI